jgi:hypothetical protein
MHLLFSYLHVEYRLPKVMRNMMPSTTTLLHFTAMANSQRPAHMGRNWTFNELNAYNIRITTVDTNTFFGISELPAPVVSPIILNQANAPAGLQLSRR